MVSVLAFGRMHGNPLLESVEHFFVVNLFGVQLL